ncbi:unnamed protein product [Discosporangium mesarthrocarpum]
MSTGEVVQAFTRAQEERVALYRKFDGGLKEMLQSGDYSAYPPLCVDVTAGFSLLSQAINMMEAMLKTTLEGKAAGDIIHRVQQEEEQKLTLVGYQEYAPSAVALALPLSVVKVFVDVLGKSRLYRCLLFFKCRVFVWIHL